MNVELERIKSIKSFPSLVKYLREELEWKIDDADIDDLTFDYEPEELGIDKETAVKVKEIKQLRPLVSNQPWGIFYLSFEPKRLPIVALRRILRSLVIKKRASANRSQMATWEQNDLLFISSYGEQDNRELTFAHFSDNTGMGDLPTLKVLGWSAGNTVLRLEDTYKTLHERLHWPDDDSDIKAWRDQWSSAFKLQYRETVRTSRDLATKLADLAIVIRESVNEVLTIETEKGELRKLYKAFQEALIHDLSEDDFADMYAQTIAYGLLSARISRSSGALVADNLSDLIPNTNPFLKELMQTFLTVGGRKSQIDFDELGINEVVELLRNANMEEVLRDFGAKNPNEDPVIHFYELFLKEYDPEKRMKRGVFYTPRPVVSFIVRSVDEILRNEFGLADGLADITTWGEMKARTKELEIPDGIKKTEPFVQILDPATGTGTFLVEVIDLIYQTMAGKWQLHKRTEREIRELWNEYVPRHLLPRIYGFELMMAPYSIAHMKIGLKLRETGYSFISSERAQIYLTNTLEESKDFSDYFKTMAPALAHEADEANRVKRRAPITVVVGNPPYSSALTRNNWIMTLVDDFKGDINEKKSDLTREEWKFLRYSLHCLQKSSIGVMGYIINNSFISAPTHRELRRYYLEQVSVLRILDLHGDSKKGEKSPDGSKDENVFDIQQGVCITVAKRDLVNGASLLSQHDLFGSRESKYDSLARAKSTPIPFLELGPDAPFYLFYPRLLAGEDEYECGWSLQRIFSNSNTGIQTKNDDLFIDFAVDSLAARMEDVLDNISTDEKTICEKYNLKDSAGWKVSKLLPLQFESARMVPFLQKPFDKRFIYYDSKALGRARRSTMTHMLHGNLGLLATRQVTRLPFNHIFVAATPIEEKTGSHDRTTQLFPLYLYPSEKEKAFGAVKRIPNFSDEFVKDLSNKLGLEFRYDDEEKEAGNGVGTFDSMNVFTYAYAVLYSPTYRARYAEFLKIDFPRLPLTTDTELFRQLSALGSELVALHLLEGVAGPRDEKLETDGSSLYTIAEVAPGFPKYEDGKVFINKTAWFDGVPEGVWSFHIGGYQICHKWLKDRKGRTLSEEDIEHYGKITVALAETIRLMAEIDTVIEQHGGFPLVGSQDATP